MTLWLVIFSAAYLAQAGEILVSAPDASPREYQAYLRAHPEFSTASEVLDGIRPERDARERLIQLFAGAQAAFLAKNLQIAKTAYRTVVDEFANADWQDMDREILLISYLRLAQLAATEEERTSYLRASMPVSDGSVDARLIPPPVLAEWKAYRAGFPVTEVTFHGLGSEWNRILIQGRACVKNPCRVRADKSDRIRITWLSDRWQPVTQTVAIDKLTRARPPRIGWLGGNCERPEWAKESIILENKIPFFDLQCSKLGIARAVRALSPQRETSALSIPATPKPHRPPLYKSKWLWLGLGTLTAVILVNSQKSQPDKRPTTTYGY